MNSSKVLLASFLVLSCSEMNNSISVTVSPGLRV
ncbi:unnamed protein product [Schistosoma mattheei]|uniref:Uncharacterized protein n=1 Tax=Schistosoma mattheei TaxID=31246 RepID=A0A3P7YEQ4_9TREM|nr:unnamed protein product [Schistosoma mattheei]